MKVRPMEQRDLSAIAEIHAQAGYAFPLPDFVSPLMETAQVITDDDGKVLMGAAAKRVPELFLFCAPGGALHPFVKIEAIKMLHEAVRNDLAPKGFIEGFAFIPPEIERAYGRHLRRSFGWEQAWSAYRILDWKGGQ